MIENLRSVRFPLTDRKSDTIFCKQNAENLKKGVHKSDTIRPKQMVSATTYQLPVKFLEISNTAYVAHKL